MKAQNITKSDLYPDDILIRKIKRMQRAQAQDAEESDSDDGTAPAERHQGHRRVKEESTVPATQQSSRTSNEGEEEESDE